MTTLYSYALCSVDDVKDALGISGSSQDDLIRRQINRATDNIESFCNLARDHHFKEATYTDELYSGGGNTLNLLMQPVTAISAVSRHDSLENGASYSAVESNLYYSDLTSGSVQLLYDTYAQYGSYKVTYTAGYSTIPADLREACVSLVSYYLDNATSGTNVKSKSEGSRSIEYFQQQGATSLIDELGLDDQLNRYVYYAVGV